MTHTGSNRPLGGIICEASRPCELCTLCTRLLYWTSLLHTCCCHGC